MDLPSSTRAWLEKTIPYYAQAATFKFINEQLNPTQKTALTGTEVGEDFSAQIIGKDIPIFVGGSALMGCRIAEGPFIRTDTGAGLVDIIVTPCSVAVPTATRELTSIRLNGTESFTSGDGGATWTPVGSVFAGVEIEVRYGTEDQLPFASSITRYGARAVPYRSHILIELKNIPLAPFNNEIPFASVQIYQDEYLTRMEGLARLAAHARFNADEYEFNVSGRDTFWIVIQQSTFMEYLQQLRRTIGRNWNIVASEKLRVFENSSTVTPIAITRDDIVADSAEFSQDPPESVPAQRWLGYIDTGRDNDFNSVKATRARFPIPLTASQESETIDIPIGMGSSAAKRAVNRSLLIDDFARDKFSCKLLPHMMGIVPGDIIAPDLDDEIRWTTGRVVSVSRNAADWTSDIIAERIEVSLLPFGPSITSNGGGETASITVNEGGTAVTTVTSDVEDGVYSIAGGDDSSFFTIDPGTGVLTFLVAPDFEDPQDTGSNNTYQVIVQVLGDGLAGTQIITVTVADISDSAGPILDFSVATNSQYIAILED